MQIKYKYFLLTKKEFSTYIYNILKNQNLKPEPKTKMWTIRKEIFNNTEISIVKGKNNNQQ